MQISSSATAPAFFPEFRPLDIEAGGVRFAGVIGGDGPPVLLLHGFPQTHVAWRRIAPTLAKRHTVVIPDLPGYGASRPGQTVSRWTKRWAGAALVALMECLGYERFAVAGHDRGARVGYRLTLDHPERIVAYASLAVVPTLDVMAGVDLGFAMRNFHWFFLAQEADLPERLLTADPDGFIERTLDGMTGGRNVIEAAAIEAYRAAFRDPAVRHAICEDYRAAVTEDLALDRADREVGRMLSCPVLVLWPNSDWARDQPTPVEIWRRWAGDVVARQPVADTFSPRMRPTKSLPRWGLSCSINLRPRKGEESASGHRRRVSDGGFGP